MIRPYQINLVRGRKVPRAEQLKRGPRGHASRGLFRTSH